MKAFTILLALGTSLAAPASSDNFMNEPSLHLSRGKLQIALAQSLHANVTVRRVFMPLAGYAQYFTTPDPDQSAFIRQLQYQQNINVAYRGVDFTVSRSGVTHSVRCGLIVQKTLKQVFLVNCKSKDAEISSRTFAFKELSADEQF